MVRSRHCPRCGGRRLSISKPKTAWEHVTRAAGVYRLRCQDCRKRFPAGVWLIQDLFYAKCSKCYRMDLSDWDEKYRYPPSYLRALLYVGAKGHRCPSCRHNFVSFRPRKRQYIPPHRLREMEGAGNGMSGAPQTAPLAVDFAHCPECNSADLRDWRTKHGWPFRVRLLQLVGGNAYYCRACSAKFVSFKERKHRHHTAHSTPVTDEEPRSETVSEKEAGAK